MLNQFLRSVLTEINYRGSFALVWKDHLGKVQDLGYVFQSWVAF